MAAAPPPAVVAAFMGYGHLRAALPLAEAFGVPVLSMDRPPLATDEDVRTWDRLRRGYDRLSRRTGLPVVGPVARALLDRVTAIPRLSPPGRLERPGLASRYLMHLVRDGFGATLVERLTTSKAPLVATFYAPAVVADDAGLDGVVCVLTDADVHRVWVAPEPARSRIVYAAPTARAAHRLRAYGVPPERIHRTGFPLPDVLVREDDARARRLAARLVRLDPRGAWAAGAPAAARRLRDAADPADAARPLRATFAVGGAGAQVELARRLVTSLAPRLAADALRLTLVAGTRADTAERLTAIARRAGFAPGEGAPVEILHDADFETYARRFHDHLAETDVLWTKPSEITFFAAAGFALALTTPLGVQERANRDWVLARGAAVDAGALRDAARSLDARRADGSLAAAAFAGATRLPRHGTARVVNLVRSLPGR
ncbi:MAG: hypothetical protein IT460_14230 [Planctomycetes bacterium]|nr:hypothetical protein [Planctomycetota bacterium]